MEAIILAGGFGTRLKGIINNIPKPMAPINNKPFLEYIFSYLRQEGINKVILSVGYKKEVIKKYFGKEFNGIKIIYSEENKPLKTGGAIKKALKFADTDNVFILNGDTFFKVNLKKMYNFHFKKKAYLTIAVKRMENIHRYGTLTFDKEFKVTSFHEKIFKNYGYINGGIYIINKKLKFPEENIFMFEDFIKNLQNVYAFVSNNYFIDIGIKEDYFKAKEELNDYI